MTSTDDLIARMRDHAPHVEEWEDGDGNPVPFADDLRQAADALEAAQARIAELEAALRALYADWHDCMGHRDTLGERAAISALQRKEGDG